MQWAEFLQKISGDATAAEIGRVVGAHRSVVGAWLKGGNVDAAVATRVARAYRANVLEALVAAGYLNPQEVDLVEVDRGVSSAGDVDLLRELLLRAQRRETVGPDRDHSDNASPAASDGRKDDWAAVAKTGVVEVELDEHDV